MIYKLIHQNKNSRARVGEIHFAHGIVETPAFVPVGTQASVKAMSPQDLREIGVPIFFANTYHLYLRPGAEVIQNLGGVHKFMGWEGPIMTDSGGFQVFSLGLGKLILTIKQGKTKVTVQRNNHKNTFLVQFEKDGVRFKSHLDGSEHFLTPEKSLQIQKQLGADIVLAFDDCTPYPVTHEYAKLSLERTNRWAERSLKEFNRLQTKTESSRSGVMLSETKRPDRRPHLNPKRQILYGVVQGSVFEDLRTESARFIDRLDTNGIAIGGVSVGEPKDLMYKTLDWVIPNLSPEKPRHLLGVGEIDDIFAAVERGIDTMDCVTPTRLGRHKTLLVHPETAIKENSKNPYQLIITNAKYITDAGPIDQKCSCMVCQNFSRAYLNHLYKSDELLGIRLGTYHNLWFLTELMRQIRRSILEDRFEKLRQEWFIR